MPIITNGSLRKILWSCQKLEEEEGVWLWFLRLRFEVIICLGSYKIYFL